MKQAIKYTTLTEYLKEQSERMDRVVVKCVQNFGPNKEDGTPRRIFPDDFWEGFLFEGDNK